MLPETTLAMAAIVLQRLRDRRLTLATAESCTGGLIAAALTHVAGSSDVVDRGFVTYSNAAKTALLGVPPDMIERDGAVSETVAAAMASGAASRAGVPVTIAVTGVAGPGGGSADKPVGLVWFGAHRDGVGTRTEHRIFPGDRAAIRAATVDHAFAMILDLADAIE